MTPTDVVCKNCDVWLISRTWRYRVTGHNPYSILRQFDAWFEWEVKR